METLTLSDWMTALVDATEELATDSLGFSQGTIVSTSEELPQMETGSCVALAGNEESLQIGIAANEKDCMALVRAFCCMEPEDEDLERQDVADALGEIVNVLAGGLKTRIAERAESMSLGLPIVLWGSINVPSATDIAVTVMRWESAEVQLWLLYHRNAK